MTAQEALNWLDAVSSQIQMPDTAQQGASHTVRREAIATIRQALANGNKNETGEEAD